MVRDISTKDFVNMLNSDEEFIPLDLVSKEGFEDIDKWAEEHFDNKDEKIVIYCGGNICGSLYEAAKLLDDKGFAVEKRCLPCEGGTPPLEEAEIKILLKEVPMWSLREGHLFRSFKFRNFKEAMTFVNSLAGLAEEEGHHPDICIHYNKVEVELWTHAIKGLSENDFIIAAKTDRLNPSSPLPSP